LRRPVRPFSRVAPVRLALLGLFWAAASALKPFHRTQSFFFLPLKAKRFNLRAKNGNFGLRQWHSNGFESRGWQIYKDCLRQSGPKPPEMHPGTAVSPPSRSDKACFGAFLRLKQPQRARLPQTIIDYLPLTTDQTLLRG
jgi:hypothetical protein